MRRIIEDLLWLARADSEPSPGDLEQVADVADVVEGCVERFGALAATQRVTLSVRRVGDGPFTVQAQPQLIDRLAGVLIDNACKFAGVDGEVEVSVRDWGNRVDLRVDDSVQGSPRTSGTPSSTDSTERPTRWAVPGSASRSRTRSCDPPRAPGTSASPSWAAPGWRSHGGRHFRAGETPALSTRLLVIP